MPKDIVLCVDDEPIVLRACTIAAAQAGFRSVVAENAAAGLDSFIQFKSEICLVLTDIVMPVTNGIALAEAIVKIAPETKILLMSGYGDDVIELQGSNRFPFIRKPFIFAVLIQKMRSLIEPTSDAATSG